MLSTLKPVAFMLLCSAAASAGNAAKAPREAYADFGEMLGIATNDDKNWRDNVPDMVAYNLDAVAEGIVKCRWRSARYRAYTVRIEAIKRALADQYKPSSLPASSVDPSSSIMVGGCRGYTDRGENRAARRELEHALNVWETRLELRPGSPQ